MDRNSLLRDFLSVRLVALRKESVDRNTLAVTVSVTDLVSLSARRAWIEMLAKSLVRM